MLPVSVSVPLPSFENRLKAPIFALTELAPDDTSANAAPLTVPVPVTVPLLTLKYPTNALLVPRFNIPFATLTSPPLGKLDPEPTVSVPELTLVPPEYVFVPESVSVPVPDITRESVADPLEIVPTSKFVLPAPAIVNDLLPAEDPLTFPINVTPLVLALVTVPLALRAIS